MIPRIALIASMVVAAALLALGAFDLRSATRQADTAERAMLLASADAREILELRGRAEQVAAGQRPTEDVIALVNAALQDAGLPTHTLRDLRPETDQAVAGSPQLRRQRVSCTLEPLAAMDLGRFLQAWLDSAPLWTPAAVEVTRHGGSDRLSCRISFSATYVAGS